MPDGARRGFAQGLLEDLRPVFAPRMVLTAWIPCLVITALHYRTGAHHAWGHDILRRLYYLPILFAAFEGGLRGGVTLSVFASLVYLPHAFTSLLVQDPADALEKGLEILLYNIVAVVAGLLVDRERRERRQRERLAARLGEALAEQRRIEAQLIRAGKLGALGEMTAGIAHEIKNPLHALKGTAEILRDAVPENVPERRMLELHIAEIDRLGQTADRFLSFARPIPADRRPVDPRSVIDRVVSLVSTQARKEGVETVVAGSGPGDLPRVTGDPGLLTQLLLNIALNGVQAMAPEGGGTLTFSLGTERQGGKEHVRMSVANTGPPIPEEDLERIFDPFHTTKDGGTGLGLSICSRIADQHEGALTVRNLPGDRGVEFSLSLPAERGGDG
ncbi:MAG TPA: ATP-binding protein [Candidatus Deferrimicrobiaceae bacterium]|nr:ATP-binding protein [Candidatus Deferrimicrobiaceae bacterium]